MSFTKKIIKDFIAFNRDVALYFDLAKIEERLKLLQRHSDDHLKFIFPVKSFPHQDVLKLAGKYCAGFDISNQNEYDLIREYLKSDSILWSSGPYVWEGTISHPLIKDIQNPERAIVGVSKSLRVNADAVDESLKSRFGYGIDKLNQLDLKGLGIEAIHLHHGVEKMSFKMFKAIILKLSEALKNDESIKWINLGGGFTFLSDEEVEELLKLVKVSFPKKQIVFEPGRWLTNGAGFCIGRIKEIVPREDITYVISSISRDCHLKWLNGALKLDFIAAGYGERKHFQRISVTGPTCYEGDKLCELESSQGLTLEDLIIIGGISGYSLAWNTSFNGIQRADIVLVGP